MSMLEVYTDGAISIKHEKKPGGWAAAYIYDKMLLSSVSGSEFNTTSQRMELCGALYGLTSLIDELDYISHYNINQVEVVSDSAYLVNCFNQMWWVEWKYNGWTTSTTGEDVKNSDLWKDILEVIERIEKLGLKITWRKVKGHSGNMYNDLVDKLAVKAKKSIM